MGLITSAEGNDIGNSLIHGVAHETTSLEMMWNISITEIPTYDYSRLRNDLLIMPFLLRGDGKPDVLFSSPWRASSGTREISVTVF